MTDLSEHGYRQAEEVEMSRASQLIKTPDPLHCVVVSWGFFLVEPFQNHLPCDLCDTRGGSQLGV